MLALLKMKGAGQEKKHKVSAKVSAGTTAIRRPSRYDGTDWRAVTYDVPRNEGKNEIFLFVPMVASLENP